MQVRLYIFHSLHVTRAYDAMFYAPELPCSVNTTCIFQVVNQSPARHIGPSPHGRDRPISSLLTISSHEEQATRTFRLINNSSLTGS